MNVSLLVQKRSYRQQIKNRKQNNGAIIIRTRKTAMTTIIDSKEYLTGNVYVGRVIP